VASAVCARLFTRFVDLCRSLASFELRFEESVPESCGLQPVAWSTSAAEVGSGIIDSSMVWTLDGGLRHERTCIADSLTGYMKP
jgi:hypothetical protein